MTTKTGRLIDHIHLRVADLEASKRFYRAALEALGLLEGYGDSDSHFHADELYVDRAEGPVSRVHLAFQAADEAAVKRFHAAALAAGGRDNGPPGPRDYHPGYYGAFVLDPDGNNIEAVWHGREREAVAAAAAAGTEPAAAPAAGAATAATPAATSTTSATSAASTPPAPRRADDPRLPATFGAERRRQERKPLRSSAVLRLQGAPPLTVRTFDISQSGLGIVAAVNLPPDVPCMVTVSLPTRAGAYASVELAATVIHSVLAAKEDGFKIGLQFAALSPEAAQAVARALGS